MEIDDALISYLEKLSKLKLSEADKEVMKKDLTDILGMMEKIQEVDTSDLDPLIQVHCTPCALREDVANAPMHQKKALENAPEKESGHFLVPKMINKS